jgi:RimJ/RimL family protein N-acetyltransferase
MPDVQIESDRLIMRTWRLDDFGSYLELCQDEEVMRFLGGKPFDRLECWRHMAFMVGHWQLLGYGPWVVEEKATGQFVGRVGFLNPEGWPAFELGWTLSRKFWGRGYATEAARRALAYAFDELDKDHVISLIDPRNTNSIKVAERLGERVEGKTDLFGREVLIYGIDRPVNSQS